MLKIAIIGARGMLGTDFACLAKENGFSVIEYDMPDFDLSRNEDVERYVDSADIIANFAAFTDVDLAEKERLRCYAVNAEAPAILAGKCKNQKKYLLHVSTDFVFGDSSSSPLKEDDTPNPLNFYGYSKLIGEQNVLKIFPDSAVIRLQWTYGHNRNNFITKILNAAKMKTELKVVDDQVGSPTWTVDASLAIIDLIRKEEKGIFHYASKGYVSRYELAKFAIEHLGIAVKIEPCSSSDFKTSAKRPLNSRFDCSKIDPILSEPRPDWKTSLFKYLSELKMGGAI